MIRSREMIRSQKEKLHLAVWQKKEILKYLDRMNDEQMDKLYGFILAEIDN